MNAPKSLLAVAIFFAAALFAPQSASATTAYDQWALSKNLTGSPGSISDPAFDADPDRDGVKNGLEWVLGGNPTLSDASSILPHISASGGSFLQSFTREESSLNETILSIEYGGDFTWPKSVSISTTAASADGNGVVVSVNSGSAPDGVAVSIPAAGNAVGGKLFTRMRATRLGPPASIVIAAGNQQSGTVLQPLSTPLRVTIKDEFGHPLPNVAVQWVVGAGNGTLSVALSNTDAQGVAICELTLGPDPGVNTVTATVTGQALSASFTATGNWDADAGAYFARVATLNGAADPIVTGEKRNVNAFIVGLKNLDLWGSLADGWSFRSPQNVGTGGTAAALKSNTANATYFNNPMWSAEGVVVDGTSKYVNVPPINQLVTNFSVIQILKNRAFPSNASSFSWAARDSLTGVSYKSQCLALSTWSYIPTDPKWQIVRTGWDLLIETYNRPPTQNAFYDLAATADQNTPTTVKLYIGGSFNGATVIPTSTSRPGSLAPSTYGYRIGGYSSQGNHDGMDGTVSMSFIFNTQLLDTQIASVHNLIRSTIGQGLGLTVAAPQPPRSGTPSELIAQTGLDQSASTGQELPLPLAVLLKDSLGNPIPNALINWSVNVAGATLSTASGVTSAQGLASTALTLGSSPGAYIVTAQLNESSLSATFNSTGLVPANASLTIEAGNAQTGIVSISLTSIEGPAMNPMVVLLKDASGNPIPRVQINWQVTQGEGTLISSAVGRQGELTPSYASSVTDAAGKAFMGLIMGDLPGPQAVLAAVAGGSQSISFSATAVLAADDHIILVQNYGAVGDGVTDDQPALQAALTAARQLTRSRVVFEKNKVYRLVATPDTVRHLTVDCGGPTAPISALSLIGNGATLRSDVPVPGNNGTGIIAGSGKWQGISTADPVIIHGLTFESTHGITDRTTDALGMNSRNQADAIKHIRIFGNTFKNFSRHVDIGGSQDVTITQNNFLMEKGYDSGAGGVNVGVWMYAETGSGAFGIFTRDTYVTNNFYDGLSALDSTSEVVGPIKACGDGLIFGSSINYVVTGNRIINFSYEGIYINYADFRGLIPLAEQTATVTGNFLDGGKGGGWGIRTSYNNTLISNNVMTNIAANGILVTRETTNPPETSGQQILNNDITMRANAGAGINVGNSHSARITGNTVRVPAPGAGISAYGISAGGAGWNIGNGSTYYAAADLKLENNVVQMKSYGDGSPAGTSIGIQIWHLTTPFSAAGNLVMDADQGLYLRDFGLWSSPYSRADYEAGNQLLRCIKNVHQ
jgi:Bacterial Ig-like domain (group 1)/Right handed beta helix region